jgi:hypothetical protein
MQMLRVSFLTFAGMGCLAILKKMGKPGIIGMLFRCCGSPRHFRRDWTAKE